jgi:hypothetical protein
VLARKTHACEHGLYKKITCMRAWALQENNMHASMGFTRKTHACEHGHCVHVLTITRAKSCVQACMHVFHACTYTYTHVRGDDTYTTQSYAIAHTHMHVRIHIHVYTHTNNYCHVYKNNTFVQACTLAFSLFYTCMHRHTHPLLFLCKTCREKSKKRIKRLGLKELNARSKDFWIPRTQYVVTLHAL